MSKKPKTLAIQPLPARIARARREGKTQHALELAQQYYTVQPCEERRELLRQVTLERGKQLLVQQSYRDAADVLGNALNLGGGPTYLLDVGQRLAMCGSLALALGAMDKLPDPAQRQRLLQHVADGAVNLGATSKSNLPTDLHAAFELTLQAFSHYEANRDEEARTAMQGIGLQSPFLEWKLFLRGLLAYHANDDVRAIENWQRLDPARLPHRLASPMRAGIDAAFLQAQPDAVQRTLRAQLMQMQGISCAPVLFELRDLLHKDGLAPAFRKVEAVVPALKQDFPDVLSRLARCFYWAIVERGEPLDVERYLHVFGRPADDPNLYRLQGLALESRGMWPEAHKAWHDFITDVGAAPLVWPERLRPRLQAAIWTHMAENAMPNRKRRSRSANPLFDLFASQTAPLKPSAETCLENAIKLAPDRLELYRALFELYRNDHKLPKAKKIAQELLKRFPKNAETLEALADLYLDTSDFKNAQEFLEKSIQANPLDRSLRGKLARARQLFGLSLTVARQYDQARAQYEQALKDWDGVKTAILCQWAIAEIKASNPTRAGELVAQALAEPNHRLACRYALVGESVRAKLSAPQKKQIAQDLKEALALAPTPAEILVLVESAAQQRTTHEQSFHGQKTQEKTILKFLDSLPLNEFGEPQLERLCTSLGVLEARKAWLSCLNHARRKCPTNPFFRLALADHYLMDGDPYSAKKHLVREHLDAARQLIEKMPRGELQQQYLQQVQEKEKVLAEISARNPSMADVLDRMFGDDGSPFGYEDEDEDDFFDYEDDE